MRADIYAKELEMAYLGCMEDLRNKAKTESGRLSNTFAPIIDKNSIPTIKTHSKRVRRAYAYRREIDSPQSYAVMTIASQEGNSTVTLTMSINLAPESAPEATLRLEASRVIVLGLPDNADAVAEWCRLQGMGAYAFYDDAMIVVKKFIWAEIERKLLISQQYQLERDSTRASRLIADVRNFQAVIYRPIIPKTVKTRLSFKESGGASRSNLASYTTVSGYYALKLETNDRLYEIAVSDHPKADDQMYEDVRFLCMPEDIDLDLFVNPYPNNKIVLRGASSPEHVRDWVIDNCQAIREIISKRIG